MVATELVTGAVIGGRYRLERLLGEGGMGVVWAAEDTVTGQRCALKLMKDPAGDPEARKRFLREGRAASAVRHPNVVRILDVLEPEGEPPAIAMELLEGESLRARLGRAPQLSPGELAEIMVPVVSAVGAAHALGIVHRDLKPENIFLARGPAGEHAVKVLDFGIAKLTALDGEAIRSTGITTGAVLGTPAYMAPEQVFAEKDLDHRADVWALGVVLYECLSGVCPTAGENVGQVLKHVVARPFEPLGALVPDLPEALSHLVARMLARDPAERPADLHEVLDVLAPLATTPPEPFAAPAPRPTKPGALAATAPLGMRPRGTVSEVAATAPRLQGRGPRRGRSRTVLAGAAGVVLFGAVAAGWWWPSSPASTPSGAAVASPLDAPDAKIACPILRVFGVEAPAGWLGAAAAAVACERARVILGGRVERTLVPAELLDLPRGPAAAFPDDPYGPPGARERSVDAARQRAQAYLDGEVTWSAAGFAVALSLHRADGTEIERADGRGPGLYEAVRSAMIALVGPGLIPKARELAPEIAAWSRTRDVDDALGVIDLAFALAHNAGGLPDECRRFGELSPRVGELGPEGRWQCAYTLGRPVSNVELDDSDRSAAGVATRIRIGFSVHQTFAPGDPERLRATFEREPTPRGRSLLAASESCLLASSRPQVARELAIVAVQSEPRNPEGGLCNPWEQLLSLERNTMGADGAWRAMQAWVPWNSYAWLEAGFGSGGPDPAALPRLRRAHVLSPFDTQIARELAVGYIAAGDRAAARGIAVALRAGGLLLHEVESTMLLVRVETSEVRFRAALERARGAAAISSSDTGWMRAQRFEIAWRAFELAVLLGHGREAADWLIERFLDPEPSLLDSHFASVPMRIPAICVYASTPDRCFARFRALRHKLHGMITQAMDEFLAGAEHYVKQRFREAARAWRPLLGGRMALASVLPEAMVDAFERTGAVDLAERVDQEVMKRAGELNGATLGHARAARRARDRGDRARARSLAEQVIEAWSLADDEPPVLAEMRRLVAELP
jgi:eukaryotic-like serine/threonine-protein kinase